MGGFDGSPIVGGPVGASVGGADGVVWFAAVALDSPRKTRKRSGVLSSSSSPSSTRPIKSRLIRSSVSTLASRRL